MEKIIDFKDLKKYDLHTHTSYSKCSILTVEKSLKTALKRGLDGIAITDHNTVKGAFEAVKLFKHDFCKRAKNQDFEVIVGEEIRTDHGEILAYYLNERIKPGNIFEVLDKIREQDAMASVAHPVTLFRKQVGLGLEKTDWQNIMKKIDAIESFNSRNLFSYVNRRCEHFAEKYSVAKTAGSDAHFWFEIGSAYTLFPKKLSLMEAIRKKKTEVTGTTKYAFIGMPLSVFVQRMKLITI